MTLDLFVNLFLLFFVGNVLGILFASNVGYITAIAFSVGAFALLRKDRPSWPRPIKIAAIWVPIAIPERRTRVGNISPYSAGQMPFWAL